MFPRKYPYYRNFRFVSSQVSSNELWSVGGRSIRVTLELFEGGVGHLTLKDPKNWKKRRELLPSPKLTPTQSGILRQSKPGQVDILGVSGLPVLSLVADQGFGVSGPKSVWRFTVPDSAEFYGMGEKTFGVMELSGIETKFWNTDVWADFHGAQWSEHPTDPPYASIPYLIIECGESWVGIALDTYHPTYMKTPPTLGKDAATGSRVVELGQEGGEPNLWIFVGDSLHALCRSFATWHGTLPVPPLWSLGYHQSRWGYAGEKDLFDLNAHFEDHGIPCDGLWLDIDYMNGYRCFSFDTKQFPNGPDHTVAALKRDGKRVVPILDPGIKQDSSYVVYQEGVESGIFCLNTEGKEFVGQVWPGETVFPDFTMPKGRAWWTEKVAAFVKNGFDGCWIDMNDPATGHVDPNDMLWGNGKDPHDAYRNAYALGMQVATVAGFKKANPKQRPFILTRSACLGSGKLVAMWTGDNLSNRFYLKNTVPCSVNLSLCGAPMNGPDIGGFGGDSDEALMLDWVKACFLFPFMRNHSTKESSPQEPWRYSDSALGTIRRYIRLRYKLLPYLYQLYVQHENVGDPILRPLFYEFSGIDKKWKHTTTQFMVGPSILQAPIMDESERIRDVFLPGAGKWYKDGAEWLKSGRYRVECDRSETPLYFREGAIVPMQREMPTTAACDLREVAFHVFVPSKWKGESVCQYSADDGLTYDYQKGKRSVVDVKVTANGTDLSIEWSQAKKGFGAIKPDFVVYGEFKSVRVNGKPAKLIAERIGLTSRPNEVWRVKT